MNVPERMPVWASKDKIRTQWLTWLCVFINLPYGVLTMFGRSDGASQVLIREAFPPGTHLWAALLLASTGLIFLGWSVTGAAGAATAWLTLFAASLFTVGHGTALATAGPVLPWGMAGFHVLVIIEVMSGLDADRERRQRRG